MNIVFHHFGWSYFSLLQASAGTTNTLKPTQPLPVGLKQPTLGYDNRLGSYAV